MHISKLVLRNYRNFSNTTFVFQKGVNTLIGENGSGKTNVFHALRILLDGNLARNAGNLKETDFNRLLGNQWKGHWIILIVEFAEVSMSDVAQTLINHSIGTDTEGCAYYSLYFRPSPKVRKQLYEFSQKETRTPEEFRKIQESISIDSYQADFFCKGQPQLLRDNDFYKTQVGDFENFIFPNPKDDQSLLGVPASTMQTSISKEFSFTFAEALRDVEADLKNHWNSPLQLLLKGIEKEISDENKEDLGRHSKALNETIGGLETVKNVQKGIVARLGDAVGETYSPSLQLRANLPENIEMLIRQLVVEASDPDDDYFGRIGELSLGAANLIYLAMKLHSYHLQLPADKSAYFLMIEEPEAHLHAHIQKTLFQKIDHNKAQIIYSTHSTHISSVSRVSAVNILSKQGKQSLVFQPTNGLAELEIRRLERYLDATRSTLLFAKSVILVEGDAEQILIPVIVKEVLGVHLDELGISIINVGSTAFSNIANIFNENRIKRKCAILTDEDTCFLSYPDNAASKAKKERFNDAQNAEKNGLERKTILDKFCNEPNRKNWIMPFYAKCTFEVEIIRSGNSNSVVKLLPEIYTRNADISSATTKLANVNALAFTEILRLAEKEGKGWFAIKLAEQVDANFNIPDYILAALAFCIGQLKTGIRDKIFNHRLKSLGLAKNTTMETFTNSQKSDVFVKVLNLINSKHVPL